jgi:hypothetical protein
LVAQCTAYVRCILAREVGGGTMRSGESPPPLRKAM